ncbi:MAG: alpha-amylase family glycosyl hydrolase [Pseudomonadota bacterium]
MTQPITAERTTPWWKGGVIYQIYPRSFQDSTGSGVGDLSGITQRLPYVAELGVDAIWLSPLFTSPMKDMGYDVSNYCDVDPMFGTLADFDALLTRAHQLGMKVMIDQVISHTSNQHPWFVESRRDATNPKADWYVWADRKPDGTPPNNWQSVFGGTSWQWEPRRRQYYLHNFLTSQPDLNFHNEDVQDAVLDSTRFWLDRGVDGFRLDTVNFYFHDQQLRDNPPATKMTADMPSVNPYGFQEHVYDKTRPENFEFLKRFRALLDEYDDRAAVGEVGDAGHKAVQTMAQYTADGDKLHMCYSFDMLSHAFSARHYERCVTDFFHASTELGDGTSWPCWAFSNHDVERHLTRFSRKGGNPEHIAELTAAILLSLPGSVCIYQGEELGLTETDVAYEDLTDPYGIAFWPEFKGRDGCRTPMVWDAEKAHAGFTDGNPWLPISKDHLRLAAGQQAALSGSTHSYYRALLAVRKDNQALRSGEIRFISAGSGDREGVFAFKRTADNSDKAICIFNLTNEERTISFPNALELEPNELTRRAKVENGTITLGAKGIWLATGKRNVRVEASR